MYYDSEGVPGPPACVSPQLLCGARGVETARRLTWSAMVVGESLVYVEQVLEDPLLPGFKSSVLGEEPARRSQQRRETASHDGDAPHLGHCDAALSAPALRKILFGDWGGEARGMRAGYTCVSVCKKSRVVFRREM